MRFSLWILAALILLPVLVAAQWMVTFERQDTIPAEMPFEIGTNAAATDGFDTAFDACPPPAPPGGGFYGYFPISDPLYPTIDKLYKDYRAINDTVTWEFTALWISGSQPESLAWNSATMPSAYGTIYLDTLSDMSTAQDMSTFSKFHIVHYPMTIYFKFITGTTDDVTPPYTANWFPECGDTNVSIDIDSMAVDVLDTQSPVLETSIEVSVNSVPIPSMFLDMTAVTGGYHISFSTALLPEIPYAATFNVAIDAEDSCHNAMHDECSFRTELPPDSGYTLSGFVYDSLTFLPIVSASIYDAGMSHYGTSDDSGYYEVLALPDSGFLFNCTASGYNTISESVYVSGADVVLDWYLIPAETTVTVTGTVTNFETSAPIEGATVDATWGATGSASDISGSDGTYTLEDVVGGAPVVIIAAATDFIPDTIVAAFSEDSTIDFALTPVPVEEYDVSGIITLEGETMFNNTTLILDDEDTTYTTILGEFEFTDVPTGTHNLVATHYGFVSMDTTFDIIDAEVVINYELSVDTSGFFPPRNPFATYDEYAWVISLTWEEPMEGDYTELKWDDGGIEGFLVKLTDYGFTSSGVLFEVAEEMNLVKVRVGYYGTVNHQCMIETWDGTEPGTVYGTQTATEYEGLESYWVEFDFSEASIILDGEFFVEFAPNDGWDSLWPMIDSVAAGGIDDYIWTYHPSSGWMTLAYAGMPGWAWLIRAYVETPDGRCMEISPKMIMPRMNAHTTIEAPVLVHPSASEWTRDPGVRFESHDLPAFTTMETMETPIGYRVYRAEEEFDDPADAEMICDTTADIFYYGDWAVYPETDYYYGVTAVYSGGESPLSDVVVGRCLEIRPEATVLIFDWDGGDTLADGGTMDEADALYDLLVGIGVTDVYISEQDEMFQHFFPYIDYATYMDDPRYDAIFWITRGYYPLQYVSTYSDTFRFLDYLDAGGRLYIEGADYAWTMLVGSDAPFSPTLAWRTGVWDIYHDGWPDSIGNVQNLTADNSFFNWSEDFTIDYHYQTIADQFVDVLEPIGGATAIMHSQTDTPDSVGDGTRMVFMDNVIDKSVVSSVYLGSMIDGDFPSTRMRVLASICWSLDIANDYVDEKPFMKPKSAVLIGNKPNPFNAATSISFKLTDMDNVMLDILDINGRIVKTLVSDDMEAGTHTVVWDGVDANGEHVSSGVYTCRLSTSTGVFSEKMALIK